MPVLKVNPSGETFEYEAGSTLLEILLTQRCFVDNPCNGKGICGKCRVKISSGSVEAPSEAEKKLLSEAELKDGIRLACFVKPSEDLEVEPLWKERKSEILTSGYVPAFDIVENREASEKFYGVAIDIGTTTVVCALVDMLTGREISNASMINAQTRYGLDVITRITYEMENKDTGISNLQTAIVDSINAMIDECCKKARVEKESIHEISVAANCTMMHMLLGVDATPIGKVPHKPIFLDAKDINATDIGIKVSKKAKLYCLPSVSAYIGADIVGGVYGCELQKQEGNVLFIDIGTNGEIVLSKGGELLCCSCAAGPALEGMNISCGMHAAEGAIEDVKITKDRIKLKVIANQEPIGICGSGILAVVKELLRVGLLSKEGGFIKKNILDETDYRYSMLQINGNKREFVMVDGDNKLLITQKDIQQVQLAKGAILSGVIALLNKAGIRMEELTKVMIAGQFGAHLSADSLVGAGILPEEVRDKLVYVGNSSKTGAYMALMSKKVRTEMEELAKQMEYMELAETDNYETLFLDCLMFPVI